MSLGRTLENFKSDLTRSTILVCGMYLYGASVCAMFETVTDFVGDEKSRIRFLNHPRIPKIVEGLGYVAATAVGGSLMIFSSRF